MSRLVWLGLVLLFAAQWAVPGMMIRQGEQTLTEGSSWRFRTAPVDPYDPFVGHYVQLSFELTRQPLAIADTGLERGQQVYARLAQGPEGFARFSAISSREPDSGDYLRTRVRFVNRQAGELWLRLPFERYYLEEDRARPTERAYGHLQREGREAWVTVKVRDGHAVLEELYLDGRPVLEFLEDFEKQAGQAPGRRAVPRLR